MRVKRLEIQGFKSFKDKTVIHFDEGITGIVGPNGCGKSNIVDAFFWVMGEQSYKHMRGTSSEDLIFNGSSKYSALGLAEATLVLETDVIDTENAPSGATAADIPVHLRAKEVSVTRRLYRSGEGEYFINGVQARLKDIQELFMDTGVGAKGYSVIEQGQIGKIVNAKPEDRRLLIEEAAGIAKYKARKKESLRKMEATQANLSRLNDVIQEIERNLNSLERQAQKARQYKRKVQELLDKEMTWGRRKTLVLRQKLDSLKSERDAAEQELVALRAELQIAENSVETERVDQLTDTKQAEDLQSQIQKISDELTQERSALDLSRRRQSDLNSQLQALEAEKTELNHSITADSERLQEHEIGAQESDVAFQEAAAQAREMDEQVRSFRREVEEERRELDATKRKLMSDIAEASDLNSRAASLLSRMESAQAQAERLRQQTQAQQEKLTTSREEAERAKLSAEAARAKRDELQTERKEQAAKIQTQEQEAKQLDHARDEANRAATQVRSRLQSLEELAAAFEGLADAPKAALEWARDQGQASRILPLANAFEVTAGYEPALEGWLENRLENLVAKDPEIALEVIQEIRDQKQGRLAVRLSAGAASVSPMRPFNEARERLKAAGFQVLGELSQFVKSDLDAASSTIANVCVVENFESLASFMNQGGLAQLGGWSIVSRTGDALDAEGTLRGGSADSENAAASILRRKRAITELQEQVASAELKHQEAEASAQAARQAVELSRARLQTLQTEIQAAEIEAATLDRDVVQMSRSVKDLESQVELTELEAKEMAEEAEAARLEREQISEELNRIVSSRSELEGAIRDKETNLTTRDAQVREEESKLQALRVTEASLRERAQSLKRELESTRSLIADRQRRLNEINRIVEKAMGEHEEFSGGESGLEKRIEELTLILSEKKGELSTVKDRLEQANAKLNSAHDRIKELHKTGDSKTAQTNQLAIEIEKISSELSHLIQNLEEKYGPGCLEKPVTSPIQEEMTEPVVTREMTAEEEQALGEEVERLRERIRRLGEVNVMAIEEFEETKKRYDHILTEKTDLERSLENLQEAIEHINRTSEDRFRKAFEAIADRFERLFPIIFGGGQAKLSLVYPEGSTDILEAGVDILAQPPGKKVVNIGLLSGGEKALTAVSLIFAIFMVKPSPFCVLDEVDAPLDDANIGKFNALLREMSAMSQFILITHNKKTMELNDVLYGVTMEEPGVSKMVSIQMQ